MINIFGQSVAHSPEERKNIFFCLWFAALLLVLDQASKIMVVRYIELGRRIEIIPGFFNLTHITNPGAAWGMFNGWRIFLLAVAAGVLIAVIVFLRWLTENRNERYWALFMVISGILGNVIDRIWRHEVVDFLDFHIDGIHWPAFNVADSSICVGIAVYFLSVILNDRKNADRGKHSGEDESVV